MAGFETKRETKDWAARREYLATDDDLPKTELTLKDAFERYAREGSPKRGGERWEVIRLARSMRDPIAAKSLVGLEPSDLAQWRDCRLQQVSPGTVRREMALLSSVLATARREWGLIAHNPMADTGKPPSPPARDRRVRDGEIRKLVATAGIDLTMPIGVRACSRFSRRRCKGEFPQRDRFRGCGQGIRSQSSPALCRHPWP